MRDKPKIITIASQPSSGKTTIAVNLAVALAQMRYEQSGQNEPQKRSHVLLVDPTNSYSYSRGAVSYAYRDPSAAAQSGLSILAKDILLDERASILHVDHLGDAAEAMSLMDYVLIDTSSYDDRTRLEAMQLSDSIVIPISSIEDPLEALCKTIDLAQTSQSTGGLKVEAIVKSRYISSNEAVWNDVDAFLTRTFGKHGPAVHTITQNDQLTKAAEECSIATGWLSDIVKQEFATLATTVLNPRRRRPFLESVETKSYVIMHEPVEAPIAQEPASAFHGFDEVDIDTISLDFSIDEGERRRPDIRQEISAINQRVIAAHEEKTAYAKRVIEPQKLPRREQSVKRSDVPTPIAKISPVKNTVPLVYTIPETNTHHEDTIKSLVQNSSPSIFSQALAIFTATQKRGTRFIVGAAVAVGLGTLTTTNYSTFQAQEQKEISFAFHDAELPMEDAEKMELLSIEDILNRQESKPKRRKMIIAGNFSRIPKRNLYLGNDVSSIMHALFHSDGFTRTSTYGSMRKIASAYGGIGEEVEYKQHGAEDYAPSSGGQGHRIYPITGGGIITNMWEPFSSTCGNGMEMQFSPTLFVSICHLQGGTPFTDAAYDHMERKRSWVSKFKSRHGRKPEFDEYPESLRLSATRAIAHMGNTGRVKPPRTSAHPNAGTHAHVNYIFRSGRSFSKMDGLRFSKLLNRDIARRYGKR